MSQPLWLKVMGKQPAVFGDCGDDCPVENVSWLDAVRFANALSKKERLEPCYDIRKERVTWPRANVAAVGDFRLKQSGNMLRVVEKNPFILVLTMSMLLHGPSIIPRVKRTPPV